MVMVNFLKNIIAQDRAKTRTGRDSYLALLRRANDRGDLTSTEQVEMRRLMDLFNLRPADVTGHLVAVKEHDGLNARRADLAKLATGEAAAERELDAFNAKARAEMDRIAAERGRLEESLARARNGHREGMLAEVRQSQIENAHPLLFGSDEVVAVPMPNWWELRQDAEQAVYACRAYARDQRPFAEKLLEQLTALRRGQLERTAAALNLTPAQVEQRLEVEAAVMAQVAAAGSRDGSHPQPDVAA